MCLLSPSLMDTNADPALRSWDHAADLLAQINHIDDSSFAFLSPLVYDFSLLLQPIITPS